MKKFALIMAVALALMMMATTVTAAGHMRTNNVQKLVTIYDWTKQKNVLVDKLSEDEFAALISNPLSLKYAQIKSSNEAWISFWATKGKDETGQEIEVAKESDMKLSKYVGIVSVYDPYRKKNILVDDLTPEELRGYLMNSESVDFAGLNIIAGQYEAAIAKLNVLIDGAPTLVEEPASIEEEAEEIVTEPEVSEDVEELVVEEPAIVEEEVTELLSDVVCEKESSVSFTLTNVEEDALYLNAAEIERLREEGESVKALYVFVNDVQIMNLQELCGVDLLEAGESVDCVSDKLDLFNEEENDVSAFSPSSFAQLTVICE